MVYCWGMLGWPPGASGYHLWTSIKAFRGVVSLKKTSTWQIWDDPPTLASFRFVCQCQDPCKCHSTLSFGFVVKYCTTKIDLPSLFLSRLPFHIFSQTDLLRTHVSLLYRATTVLKGKSQHTHTHLGVSTNRLRFQLMAIWTMIIIKHRDLLAGFYHGFPMVRAHHQTGIQLRNRASKSPNWDTRAWHAASADGEHRTNRQRWKMDLSVSKTKGPNIFGQLR